jgi:hypothetical protein
MEIGKVLPRKTNNFLQLGPSNKLKLEENAIIIQKYWRRYIYRKKYIKIMKRQKKKNYIAFELLSS